MTDSLQNTLKSHYFNTTHYIECGPAEGPLMIFLHGWPEISLMWRAQMETFAQEGWRCIAPDLRGYGGSAAPTDSDAYTIELIVADMTALHDHLGGRAAVWIGHDWGSVVAGQLSVHHPLRSRAVVLTSLAYFPDANALSTLVPLVDRNIYPADEYPDGQWDYYRFYTTDFDSAIADLNADKFATLASIFRSGNPDVVGKVSPNALVTRNGGRFGTAHRAPPVAPDPALWPSEDFDVLFDSFEKLGFGPACSWYLNDSANVSYARKAPNQGRLSQPVLFINGNWDQICSINGNRQGEPMRSACRDLTIVTIPAGHWLPLECKTAHIEAIRDWLAKIEVK